MRVAAAAMEAGGLPPDGSRVRPLLFPPTVLLALVLTSGSLPLGADGLPFADALARVRSSHESLAAARELVGERENERKEADGLRLPSVDFNARYTFLDDPIVIDLDPIRQVILKLHPNVPSAAVPPFLMDVQGDHYLRMDVRATWPVYTGGKVTAARRAARARVADAREEARATEEGLVSELVRRYFAVRLARRAREVRAEVLAAMSRHLDDARRLEAEGLISKAERLHADVARAEAERQLGRADHDLALARTALAALLPAGTDPAALDPSTPLFVPAEVPPLDELRRAAAEGSPALGRLAAQGQLARQGAAAEKAAWLPTVALFGLRELYKPGLTILDPVWATGVTLRFTLFDGLARERRVAAAEGRVRRVEELSARAARDVATLVERRWREAQKARDQYLSLASALELSRESVRVRARGFEEGMATSLDVVDARLSLQKVELERLLSAYELDVALAGLLEAAGQAGRFDALCAAGLPAEGKEPEVVR